MPPTDWPGHKTLSITVTPFKKSCKKKDNSYRCLILLGPVSIRCWLFPQALFLLPQLLHTEGTILRRENKLRPRRSLAAGRDILQPDCISSWVWRLNLAGCWTSTLCRYTWQSSSWTDSLPRPFLWHCFPYCCLWLYCKELPSEETEAGDDQWAGQVASWQVVYINGDHRLWITGG